MPGVQTVTSQRKIVKLYQLKSYGLLLKSPTCGLFMYVTPVLNLDTFVLSTTYVELYTLVLKLKSRLC
jgi:hypothetical protein